MCNTEMFEKKGRVGGSLISALHPAVGALNTSALAVMPSYGFRVQQEVTDQPLYDETLGKSLKEIACK